MHERADVIVVGLGAAGAAAAWQCARRGARVLGFDRWTPPHNNGSSFGRTRIIREAYYEHPLYVPLIRRAYALWDELAGEAGVRLFHRTGGAMIGPADGLLVEGALASACTHGIEHELLEADAFMRRCPGYLLEPDWVALVERNAGLLLPEACITGFLDGARSRDADLRFDTRVTRWQANERGVRVETDRGRYEAERLILATGAWLPGMLADLDLPLEIERQVLFWFAPVRGGERFDAQHSPIALWEYEPDRIFATFPDLGDGLKAGIHHDGPTVAPAALDAQDRAPTPDDERRLRVLMQRWLPEANGALRDGCVCMYTNAPDHHFVVDRHPAHDRVAIASACSGHGFKFATATGELLAQLALDGATDFDLAPFALRRFDAARSTLKEVE